MGIALEAPLALLLLVPAFALTLGLHLASRRRLGVGRRRLALAVRGVLLSALVLALAGLQLVLPVDRLATVFVVDLSDSVGAAGREEALTFLRETLIEKPEGDVAGIVAFGREALVERLPSDLAEIEGIASRPVTTATDIGAALRLATALFPDDSQKRIVLLSDGNDTAGSGQAEAALAASQGVQVETRQIGPGNVDEVLVERLTTPSTAALGESIQAVAEIRSSVNQPATVRLFVDGTLVATERVEGGLRAGVTPVSFTVEDLEAGFHTFRTVVEAGRDTFSENDRADSNTIVKGEPRTLVLAGDDTVAAELVAALEGQRQLVDTMIPEALPTDFASLAGYDSIVIADVARLRLSDRQLAALQVYVRDLGRGLVMIGGPRSYGAGGYQKTPLEETLPVDMGVRDRQKQPDIALVVVIDQSGSMAACHCNTFNQGGAGMAGVRKVDIGKEAILRAAAALTERDELGVVAFNETAHWVVRTQPLGAVEDLQGAITAIQPDGQTNIFAGLDQAVQSLEGVAATRRHIILLTDGWSSTGQYDEILARMKAAGITLSTVGAGGGSNPFLEGLAQQGGGRFYNAANPGSIPDIFLKETQQVSGQQIVEEAFFPIQTSSSPILRGLEEGLPQLRGYNGTTSKPAAQVVLVTARDDPLLAQWQYGLGRSVAWTSDATGRWAKDWIAWPGFNRFFSQLVSWTFPGEETGGIEATFESSAGDTTLLHVESVEADGSPRDFYSTSAVVVGPDLEPRTIDLVQVAPGVYEAPLGGVEPGAYAVRITQTRPGSTPLGRTVGLVAPTSAEYRVLGANGPVLAALRAAGGGTAIETPLDPWRHDLSATDRFTELWPALLVLALLLWPLDIALRRMSLGRREFAAALGWVAGIGRRRRATGRRTATGEGLLAARERAGSTEARAALRAAPEPRAVSTPINVPAPAGQANLTVAPSGLADGPSIPPPSPASSATSAAPGAAASVQVSGPESPQPTPDTITRLQEAKRRARER